MSLCVSEICKDFLFLFSFCCLYTKELARGIDKGSEMKKKEIQKDGGVLYSFLVYIRTYSGYV